MNMPMDASYTLVAHAVEAMLDKKARDVTVMDMREVAGFVDYFVIGTGDSELQIKAVAEEIRVRLHTQCSEKPWHLEGADVWQWVLLDYVDVVVHVFSPKSEHSTTWKDCGAMRQESMRVRPGCCTKAACARREARDKAHGVMPPGAGAVLPDGFR